MRPVLARLAVAVATVGTVAAVTWMPTSTATASSDFTCVRDLQQACAIVFGPLCRPSNCY
jgi:hypothetical protein